MAGQKFTLTFDAQLNVNQMKSALSQIQSTLNGLHLPQNVTKGLQGTFDKLSKEIQDFEVVVGKDITSKADFKKLETQANKITEAFGKLKVQVRDLAGLSGKDLEKLFPQQVTTNIANASKALKAYKKNMDDANDAVKVGQNKVDGLNKQITDLQNKKIYTNLEWKKLTDDIKAAENELENYKNLKKQAETTKLDRETAKPDTYKHNSIWHQAVKDIQKYDIEIQNVEKHLAELNQQKINGIKQENYTRDLNKYSIDLTEAENKLKQLKDVVNQLNSTNTDGGLKQLIDQIGTLTGLDMSKFKQDTTGVAQAIQTYLNQQLQQLSTNLQGAQGSVDGMLPSVINLRDGMRSSADAMAEFDTRLNEVNALKSRILYFFSLNNSIMLLRRTMRAAFDTIKDLDKAMTATAVVTDFSVGDMWAQLPEYTRRANELGVTTKEAYEAATLYYQQGLKTNEVMAISNETLKMARIAGLEASDATDRMTNALRGFNMEINETNAQRIDDVYSRLAAISASNVDEISTAMTKVASLAHSANMEFETTAAFLAQIIETTRESAETAGTALKTVVARFSEVKELYSEGDLRGQDEEGEVIDVNKISKALRTAGIDLNKYFLGEVGLDDIFMELASKWDSLTSVQQRYIATQAAGSRQQSRFIALMSDYARTQELVGEAYTANGAAATQFAKTQESLQSKLARLKNAWDQFAMGILNSDIVKIGVDLLTNLLNGINALTSGFGLLNEGIGGVINTLLKLGLVIGGLNLGRGLFTGAIGSLAGQGTFSQIASTAMFGAQGATGILSGLAGKGGLGMAAAGFLKPLVSGLSLLGKFIGPLAVISTTIGAIVLAYKTWQKYTPEGQLKTAKKLAEKNQQLAQEAKATADGYKQVQEEYKKYSDAVSKSTNKAEHDTAIKEQNDYLFSLIEQDKTYAQYIKSAMTEGGQIILTLDEEAFAKATDKMVEAASEASVQSYFANAKQFGKEVEFEVSEIDKADYSEALQDLADQIRFQYGDEYVNTTYDKEGNVVNREIKRDKIDELPQWMQDKYLQYTSKDTFNAEHMVAAELARRNQAAQARLGYAELLSDSVANKTISNEIADNLAAALGNIFKDTGDIGTDNLNEIVKMMVSSSAMQNIASVMAGNIDANLLNVGEEDFFKELGIEESDIDQFTDILGKDGVQAVKDFIKSIAAGTKEVQKQNRSRLSNQFVEAGVNEQKVNEFYNNTDLEIQDAVSEALEKAQDLLTSQQLTDFALKLINPETTKDDIEEIQTLLSQINLDDSLAAFTKLETKFKNGSENAKYLYNLIKDSNPEIFNTATLIKDNLSVAYSEVSDKVLELLEDNEKLTPENIEELSKESKVLKQLLDAGVVSIKSLAAAFTMAGKEGTDWLDNVNESVLKVLDNMYTFDDMINEVHNFIANFDEGIDYGEGIDFFSDKLKELGELVDNFEFGNQRTINLWNALFGDKQDYMATWKQQGEDYIRSTIAEFAQMLENDGEGLLNSKYIENLKGSITALGDGTYNWDLSKYDTLQDAIDDIANAFQVADGAAQSFIESFVSHGTVEMREAFDELSLNSAFNEVIAQSSFWSEDELKAIAASFGYIGDKYDNFITQLQAKFEESGKKLHIGDTFTGQESFEQFKETVGDYDKWIGQFATDTEFKLTELRSALSQMGYTAEQQADLIKQIAADKEIESPEITLNNLSLLIATDGLTLDESTNVFEWLEDQLSNGKVKLTDLVAFPFFKALTDQQKAMVMLTLAQNCKGEKVNFIGLTADLSNAGLDIDNIATILDTILPNQFNEKSITFSSLATVIDDLSLDEATGKTKEELLGILANLFTTYNTTNPENLGDLRIALSKLNLTETEIDNLLNNLGVDIENRSKTKPPTIDIWPKINVHMDDETDLQAAMANVTANLTQEGKIPAYLPGKAITWLPDDQEIARIFDEAVQNNKIYGVGGAYQLIGQYLKAQFTTQDFKADPKLQGMLEQWAAAYFRAGIATLPEITSASQNGQEIEISADAQDYEETLQNVISTAATSAEDQAAETAVVIEGDLNGISVKDLQANMQAAIDSAFGVGFANAQVMANGTHFTATITFIPNMLPFTISLSSASAAGRHGGGGPGSSITESYSSRATGGKLPAVSKALTGEEGPEIVWNKEQGYSYITGANGPEFRSLNAGDEVFNAQETKKILQNSKHNQLYNSYANGETNVRYRHDNNGGGGNSEEGVKSTWRNELDWLYNLLEDIAELERRQSEYAEQHDQLLNSINTTGEELFKLTELQLDNLKEQLENQRVRQQKRKDELEWWAEYADAAGLGKYVWWNDKDQTIEIDWDQIEAITDQDTYDEVKEIIDHLEQAQDEMDDATSAILDIQGQIQDLENRYMQEFTDFQQRIYDALVNQYQVQIDQLSELNNTLNDTNASILDSLQREIDLQRQIRDNTDTENNIRDMEARLAYLRRDTTGSNENEIRQLERELEEARQNYSDTLIDQSLDRLQQVNNDAAEQRQQQIELLTEQLNYWKESGELWGEVARLMREGIDSRGTLIEGSELEQILRNAEGWKAMSEVQREVWGNELIAAANQAGAYLLKLATGFSDLANAVWSALPEDYRPASDKPVEEKKSYATGGLATKSGPAWLDGSINEPEYVLNAKQTDAFLRLADILPTMLSGGISNTSLGGNVYVELNMNVGEISDDYGVDRLVERVKSDIYAASNYRNVNAVNFVR